MASLASLPTLLNAKLVEIEALGNRVAVAVAKAIDDDLTQQTPVDTSQALSNWQASLDAPARAQLPPYVPGTGGSTQAASAEAARRAAAEVLAFKRPGQPLYLSNALPYIAALNDGSSKQAPAGFVERAVLIGRSIVRNWGA